VTKAHHTETLTALAVIFALPSFEQKVAGALALAAPEAHPDIIEHFRLWAADTRKALSRADCMHEGGWGQTSQVEKENSGALRSLLDGKKRLITASSFYQHLITRLILSHPADAPAPKGTATSTRFVARKAKGAGESSEAGV
jgi:hypothetical protein